jgi:4-amino-4-deoxy-L-arabinose transferase-like glycosyltransferase
VPDRPASSPAPAGPYARRRESAPARRLPAALALLLLLVLAAALLHVPTGRVPLFYDILGYTAQARSLLDGHGNTLRVGDAWLPGYYPAGLPLLLTVPYVLLGPDMRHGVLTVLAFALVAVGSVHVLARRLGGSWAGAAAALLLLSSPMFRQMSGYVMTQVPTGALIVVAVLLFARARSATALFLAGLLAVASLLLRFANVTFPLALGCAALATCWSRTQGPGARLVIGWRPLLAVGAGFLAGGALVLAHNAWAYGDALSTGYAVWSHDLGTRFSWRNLLWPAGAPNRPEERWVLVKAFVGLSPVQSVPFVLCALAGLVTCLRDGQREPAARRLAAAAVCTLGLQYLFLALYSFRSDNYVLPGVPLTAVLAGVGLARLVPARAAALAPVLAGGMLAWDLAHAAPPPPSEAQAIQHHDSLVAADALLEDDAAVITAGDPGLVEPLLRHEGARRVLYVGPFVSPLVEHAALAELGSETADAPAIVDWALRQSVAGRPVYLDQNPPPRGITGEHVTLRKGLHARYVFEETAATNVFRLRPIRQD